MENLINELYYNDVKAEGRIRKKADGDASMSASYVRGLHMMLHNCLGRAVKERLILRNPTEDCIVPKLEKKEMNILNPEDISAYLKEADRRGVLAMFFLELTTGLRKGELVALVDLVAFTQIDTAEAEIAAPAADHGSGRGLDVDVFHTLRDRELYKGVGVQPAHDAHRRIIALKPFVELGDSNRQLFDSQSGFIVARFARCF